MTVSNSDEGKWPPVTIFYVYAREDEELRDKIAVQMSGLRRPNLVTEWHDREILPGIRWADAIDEHLASAQIILILISADFLASDYCYSVEMMHALKRYEAEEAV
jgi:hypothetical protein